MKNKNLTIKVSFAALLLAFNISGCETDHHDAILADSQIKADNSINKPDNTIYNINNIYLASPFFNDTEVKNIEYVESVLEDKGLAYFSPMRHSVDGKPGTPEWAHKVFNVDKGEIEKADAVVALYYGNTSDSGTAWECGYAYSIGKPVVLVHIDRDGDSNLMMHCGCWTNIYLDELKDYNFETMPVYEYEGKMFKEE